MHLLLIIVIFAALLALGYASFNFFIVKKMDEGTEKMQEIATAIREGANTFIVYEYKIIAKIAAVIAVIIAIVLGWQTACAFIIGAIMSASAGWVGMKIATYANVRVSNKARLTNSLSETLKVAFQGGSVMGLCVGGFALLGIFIIYIVFGILFKQIDAIIDMVPSRSLVGFATSFSITLSGYALGCSIIALFNRVGGGIYTKAADMGADLVGKSEAHIPEDDPRNPATIADNVGDNVGDVAGLGSDLLESYVGAILSAVILAAELFKSAVTRNPALLGTEYVQLIRYMMFFPIIFAALGLVACVIGIGYLLTKKKLSENPHRELNMATWVSAGITLVFGFALSMLVFNQFDSETLKSVGFAVGKVSPWLAAALGIIAGIVIGMIAEYYTSYDFKPTLKIAHFSLEGSALTITQGLANGMKSTMAPVLVLGFAIFGAYKISGMYGVACAAFGMLSFVAATVSVDTYGPISDNAGGIAEMSKLDKNVRSITDKLDSVGNTTAAIGKGFAIGSAALAALSMMSSYMYTWTDAAKEISLNLIDPLILAGALIGAALPFLFSGMLIEAVANAARKMVDEVRRQFREIKGLLEGEVLPDYKTCIAISTQGALKEMRVPALMSILFPVISGFLFGPQFVGGILIGATITAVMLAVFTGNAGGAWDNAKKYIETGAIEGHGKGSAAHDASIVGDTVGDPLKDTVGPSLDILIKIMATVSLVSVIAFSQYNLLSLFG